MGTLQTEEISTSRLSTSTRKRVQRNGKNDCLQKSKTQGKKQTRGDWLSGTKESIRKYKLKT